MQGYADTLVRLGDVAQMRGSLVVDEPVTLRSQVSDLFAASVLNVTRYLELCGSFAARSQWNWCNRVTISQLDQALNAEV